MSSNNKEEYDVNLPEFVVEESNKQILFEVFTKKETDAKYLLDYIRSVIKL